MRCKVKVCVWTDSVDCIIVSIQQLCHSGSVSSPLLCLNNKIPGPSYKEPFPNQVRALSTSSVHRDIDSAAKVIGAGMATVGVGGCGKLHREPPSPKTSSEKQKWEKLMILLSLFLCSGTGVGIVFGNLMTSYARNPSLKNQLFSYAVLGFALTEAMGLFCLMMAFLFMYA